MTLRHRQPLWVVPLCAVMLALAACSGKGSTGATTTTTEEVPDSPPLRLPGNDIGQYIALQGDQAVTVPNGTYTAGDVAAPHPETSGPYKGWLVLVAEKK